MDDNAIIDVSSFQEWDDILFKWLYHPFKMGDIKTTIETIKKLGAESAISEYILFYKIVEFLKQETPDINEIVNTLDAIDMSHLTQDIKRMLDEITPKKEDFTLGIIKHISTIYNKYNKEAILIHQGYPLPDPEKGRPQLEWCECYHKDCHKAFDHVVGLVDHLKGLGKYKQGLHVYHENIVKELGLTPDIVVSNSMIKCPSYICNESTKIFTPETLCEHFVLLGIPPFWQQGTTIDDIYTGFEDTQICKIDYCIVCDQNKSCVLFSPCHHVVTCFNCYAKVNKCPYCNANIEFVLPF